MGTNYYAYGEECSHCGHAKGPYHIGKSSMGWKFLFRYDEDFIIGPESAKWATRNFKIRNEYGDEVSHEEFWELVEAKQNLLSHAEEQKEQGLSARHAAETIVIAGYEFLDNEFS